MELEWYIYVLAILGGFAAGFINTLAGSGSLITLPILIFLGLPATVANGTNRLGVLLQSFVGTATLKQRGKLSLEGSQWLIIPSVIGAILGAVVAVDVSEQTMRYIIGAVMVVMLIPIVFNSDKWLRETSEPDQNHKNILSLAAFFVIGIYGGFLQGGVGILLLTSMVLISKLSINHANTFKNLIVFCFTIPAFIIFIMNDQVDWFLGVVLAIGQVFGAWIAARFATDHPAANSWIRRLLIVVIVVSVVELFELRQLILGS